MQAYIVSKADLKVKGVYEVVRYKINEDTAAPAQSSYVLIWPVSAATGDYLYIRDTYQGIVSGIEAGKSTSVVTLRTLPVSSLFSRNILLGSTQEITEEFIGSAIQDNFVSSGDNLLDLPYINVQIKTQTSLGITPDNSNGIYNLDTFLRYAASRYHVFADYAFTADALNVSLENLTPPTHIIDATVADVLHVTETVVSECVSKVTVKTSSDVILYYLFEDGSYGTDPTSGARVIGKAETVYCANAAEAEKVAGDVFAKNKYSHLIETEILSESKLYNTAGMRLYDRAKVKTKTGIYDTYISYMSKKSTVRTVLFRFGDAKVSLTDKLKGGS